MDSVDIEHTEEGTTVVLRAHAGGEGGMSLLARVVEEQREDVSIAAIEGEVDASNVHEVGERLRRLLTNRSTALVVDLTRDDLPRQRRHQHAVRAVRRADAPPAETAARRAGRDADRADAVDRRPDRRDSDARDARGGARAGAG